MFLHAGQNSRPRRPGISSLLSWRPCDLTFALCPTVEDSMPSYPVTRSDAEWRELLTPEQYRVMRGHGTEPPGSCALNHEKRAGTFSCVACGQPLFASKQK